MRKALLSLMLIFCFSSVFAAAQTEQSVTDAGQQWAAAIQSRNAEKITSLYDDNAFLFATFENMLSGRTQILPYFQTLTKHQDLSVKFDQQNIRLFGNTSTNSGLYTFSFTDNGKPVHVNARYIFVYTLTPKGWMIIEHHSSVLPN